MMDFPRDVYAIQHNVTGRIYVGSTSKNVNNRYRQHMCALRAGKHTNVEMQRDFDEYGEDYTLFVVDRIADYEHRSLEKEWMEKLRTNDTRIGYNGGDPYFKKKIEVIRFSEGIPVPNQIGEE